MNLGHPSLKEMINLGCTSQIKIFLAFQTYLELCEVHKVQAVSYKFCKELDIIYLIASTNGIEEVYIPLSHNDTISPQKIKSYLKFLSKDISKKEVYIVIRDVDTSCVIYKISEGLENPLSPTAAKEKKDFKEKRTLIENEIKNLLPTLIQEARTKETENNSAVL